MSNIIEFIERLGRDATLRNATAAEIEEALSHAGVEPALRPVIFADDPSLLESLLGARTGLCCMIAPAREEEEESEDDGGGEDGADDEREEEAGTLGSSSRRALRPS